MYDTLLIPWGEITEEFKEAQISWNQKNTRNGRMMIAK